MVTHPCMTPRTHARMSDRLHHLPPAACAFARCRVSDKAGTRLVMTLSLAPFEFRLPKHTQSCSEWHGSYHVCQNLLQLCVCMALTAVGSVGVLQHVSPACNHPIKPCSSATLPMDFSPM